MIFKDFVMNIDKEALIEHIANIEGIEEKERASFRLWYLSKIADLLLIKTEKTVPQKVILCIKTEDFAWRKDEPIEDRYYYDVFGYELPELLEKYPAFSNIDGYALEFSPFKEWLGWLIPDDYIHDIELATEIFEEIFFFGYVEEEVDKKSNEIMEDAKKALEQIELSPEKYSTLNEIENDIKFHILEKDDKYLNECQIKINEIKKIRHEQIKKDTYEIIRQYKKRT